jgi:hypothetical protein
MPYPANFAWCGKKYPAKMTSPANFAGFFVVQKKRVEVRKAFVLSQKLIIVGSV